jgi:hypothetical protein
MKESTGIKNNARQRNEMVVSKRENIANSHVGALKLCAFRCVGQYYCQTTPQSNLHYCICMLLFVDFERLLSERERIGYIV